MLWYNNSINNFPLELYASFLIKKIFSILVTLIGPEEIFLKHAGLIINFPSKEITEPLKPPYSHGDLGIITLHVVLFYSP